MKRTGWVILFLLASCAWAGGEYPEVRPGHALVFPRDHGSHPEYRVEWWYLTGWVKDESGRERGIQITFFRNRPMVAEDNPSRFAPTQLLFAHAAVADASRGRLLHDQRAARAGFGLAEAERSDTAVHVHDWRLERSEAGYSAHIPAQDFELRLSFVPTQPSFLQGEQGFSQKGPQQRQASYYYSLPQLEVSGVLAVDGTSTRVSGTAWLDHEWSSELMAAAAVGWDWTGLNLDDGGALMAFRLRDAEGKTVWAGGGLRLPGGAVHAFRPRDVEFRPMRTWRSPRTGAEYPVDMQLRVGERVLRLQPLMDDQELDARKSTGTIYWEGAVIATHDGTRIGRGYLELTGYWKRLRM